MVYYSWRAQANGYGVPEVTSSESSAAGSTSSCSLPRSSAHRTFVQATSGRLGDVFLDADVGKDTQPERSLGYASHMEGVSSRSEMQMAGGWLDAEVGYL